jgi:hypothetical protein
MFIRDGFVFKRSGYSEFVVQDLNGIAKVIWDFQLENDTKFVVVVTTTRQYYYNEGTNTWDDITATQAYHKIVNVDDGDPFYFYVSGNQSSRFIVGSSFVVSGSSGNDATYVVTGVLFSSPTTRITVANIPDATVDGYITGVFYPIVAADETAETFTILGDHTTLFTVGKSFIVVDSTGNDAEYTVISSSYGAPNTTITVADVPDATDDGSIELLYELTTVDADYIDYCVGTDANTHRFYFTNGRDRPRFWDGSSGSRFLLWYPEYTSFTTCKSMEVFFDSMLLGGIVTTAPEPKTIAWSNIADFEDFEDGTVGGALLIPALDGSIQRIESLGDRLIVYSDNSIAELMFLGPPIYFSTNMLISHGSRLISGNGIVSIGSAHLIPSQENIYFFDGTKQLRGVGDSIRLLYRQELNFEFGKRLFSFNDVAKRTVFIVVPTSSTTATIFVLDYDIYDLNQFIWTKCNTTDLPTAFGYFARRSSLTWNTIPDVAWEEYLGIWRDEGATINFPVRAMGSGSEIFLWDEVVGLDKVTSFDGFYETIDFNVPEIDESILGRWGEVEFDLLGTSVDIYYSIDGGSFWYPLKLNYNAGSTFSVETFDLDVASRKVRFKIESDKYFALRAGRVWVRPGGPR